MCQNGVLSQGLPALPPLSMPLFLTLSLALLGVAVSCIFLCHFLVGSAVCHLTCCCMQIKCLPQHKVDFCPKLTARWRLLSVQNKKKRTKLSASLRTHNGSWQCRTPREPFAPGNAGARVSLLINKCIAIARRIPPSPLSLHPLLHTAVANSNQHLLLFSCSAPLLRRHVA